MEGSIVSRIQLPRTAEMHVAMREPNSRMRRSLREPGAQTPFSQLWVTIARRKWFLLAMALLGGVIAAIVGFSRPAQFEATTQILVDGTVRNTADGAAAQDMLDTVYTLWSTVISNDDFITMLSPDAKAGG